MSTRYLLGDIGGTNARFVLWQRGDAVGEPREFGCGDFATFEDMLAVVLDGLEARPDAAVLAVAAPVIGDAVTLTNRDWHLSASDLATRFGLGACRLLNDFTAVAWSLPGLTDDELDQVGGTTPVPGTAKAVLGPGTGLGVSALVPCRTGWAPVEGEGGHASLASEDDFEAALLLRLQRTRGHVSHEAALSGDGLVALYRAVLEVTGHAASMWSAERVIAPADVTRHAADEPGGPAGQAVAVFCRLLGAYAGDLALIFGARGGVYIAGGIVPKLGPLFDRDGFRQRFEAKGRFRNYLVAIPAYVIRAPYPALAGLSQFIISR